MVLYVENHLTYLFLIAFVYGGCHNWTEIDEKARTGQQPKKQNYMQEAPPLLTG